MKLKNVLKSMLVILIIAGTYSCKEKNENKTQSDETEKKAKVFNFDNKTELSQFNKLNLDETHPNLLNPQISKTDYNSVVKSWTGLHQNIGKYLSDKKFTWNAKDSTITIIQKFYFNKNGEIENYFFRIKNKEVSKEKKEQFANLISDFSKSNKIDFKKNECFAQCGKAKYLNK
jgi:hypothetical protein